MTFFEVFAGLILLLFGAEFLVRGAVALARRLEVSEMLIGMTIVAYGTTTPELVASLEAALIGAPGIAVGNVVGSNIANILLILGTSAVIFPIACRPRVLYRDGTVMLGVALLFAVLGLSGALTQWQGALMLAALIGFSVYAYVSERRARPPPKCTAAGPRKSKRYPRPCGSRSFRSSAASPPSSWGPTCWLPAPSSWRGPWASRRR